MIILEDRMNLRSVFMVSGNPIEIAKANKQIKVGVITATVQVVLLLLITVILGDVLPTTLFYIDIAVIAILAIALMIKKSRIAACLLLAYYIFPRVLNPGLVFNSGATIFMTIAFVSGYISGIRGTFAYQSLKSETEVVIESNPTNSVNNASNNIVTEASALPSQSTIKICSGCGAQNSSEHTQCNYCRNPL
jgi:hypothetical protein